MPGLLTARELRQKARRLSTRADELLDAEDTYDDEGLIKPEVRTELDRIHEDQESFLADAERIERHEDRQEQLDRSTGVRAGREDTTGADHDPGEDRALEELSDEERKRKLEVAFDGYLRFGLHGIRPEYRHLIESRYDEVDRSTGTVHEARAQATNVDTAGGYLVPEGFFGEIIEAQKAFGGIRRSRATVITTDSGNDIPIPTDDDTSNKGEIIGENTGHNEQDLTFGQVMLHSYTYSSKIVKVSRQLLDDSAFPLQPFLSRKFGQRLGRITEEHFATGDDASKPEGFVNGATVGATAASATALDPDELTDLFHAVDPAYRMNGEFMLSDPILKEVKLLKDGEGRRLWQSGIATREPNTIEGRPYIVNQEMSGSLAASEKVIAFGDFSQYYVRDVQGMLVLRLDERYAENLQVGFLAFSRHDGRLVDAGTNPVQVLQMASS